MKDSLVEVKDDMQAHYADNLQHLQQIETDKVGQRQHVEFESEVDARINRLQNQLDHVETDYVPAGTNKEHWDSQAAEFVELQGEIDEVKKELQNIFSAQDVIEHMQKQLDELNSRIYGMATSPTIPALPTMPVAPLITTPKTP